VDLRWGIPDERKAEGKVLPICLAEIQNCARTSLGFWASGTAGCRARCRRT